MNRAKQNFKEGDTVRLKTGSPRMSINIAISKPDFDHGDLFSGYYECVWFEGSRMIKESFHQDALELSE